MLSAAAGARPGSAGSNPPAPHPPSPGSKSRSVPPTRAPAARCPSGDPERLASNSQSPSPPRALRPPHAPQRAALELSRAGTGDSKGGGEGSGSYLDPECQRRPRQRWRRLRGAGTCVASALPAVGSAGRPLQTPRGRCGETLPAEGVWGGVAEEERGGQSWVVALGREERTPSGAGGRAGDGAAAGTWLCRGHGPGEERLRAGEGRPPASRKAESRGSAAGRRRR